MAKLNQPGNIEKLAACSTRAAFHVSGDVQSKSVCLMLATPYQSDRFQPQYSVIDDMNALLSELRQLEPERYLMSALSNSDRLGPEKIMTQLAVCGIGH